MRPQFTNDATPAEPDTASKLLEQLRVLHAAAEADFTLRSAQNRDMGRLRAYAGNRGGYRKIPGANIPDKGYSDQFLFLVKLFWPDALTVSDQITGVQRVAAGAQEVREAIDLFLKDGLFESQRRVNRFVEANGYPPAFRPVPREVLDVLLSLSATGRFAAVERFHRRGSHNQNAAVSDFIALQNQWRARNSYRACRILDSVARDFANLRYFSATDTARLRVKYHEAALPPFPNLTMIQTIGARLAICAEASVSVRPNSNITRLDLSLATQIAKKYNAYLTSQSSQAPFSSYKSLILLHIAPSIFFKGFR